MNPQFKFVLVGFGNMGRNHARVIAQHPEAELLAVVDPRAESGPSEVPLHRVPLQELPKNLLDQADAFVVATSTETHHEVMGPILALKKPILLEKPASHRLDLGRRMVEEAKSAGTAVRVGHLERLNPAVLKLREVIESGVLGVPIHYSFTRAGGYPSRIRSGNNVIVDLAVHDLDVLARLAGRARLVGAVTHRSRNPEHVDTAEILLRTESQASASMHVNWVTPTKIRTLRVTGTRGVCFVDYILQSCVLQGGDLLKSDQGVRSDYRSLVEQYQSGDRVEFGVVKTEPLQLQLNEFMRLLRGESSTLCTLEESLASLELAIQALELGARGVDL